MISGIRFAGIPVLNLDAALNFCVEKLGCKVVTHQPFTVPARGACHTHLLQTSLGYSRRVYRPS